MPSASTSARSEIMNSIEVSHTCFDWRMAVVSRSQWRIIRRAPGLDGQFAGARFSFLAANVLSRDNEQPIVAPTQIKNIDGVRIGFIGAVTRSTPGIVVPSGVAGVRFVGEAKAINHYAKELQAQGVQAIVAVVHEGGDADGGYDACRNPRGPIFDIARELDQAIDIVLSAHTHRGYNCVVDGRVIIQAASYGRLVSVIDIEIDRSTGRDRARADTSAQCSGAQWRENRLRAAHCLSTADA